MELNKINEKLSGLSTLMIIWVLSLGLVILSTPQYPVDFNNNYVRVPVLVLLWSLWNDFK